MSREDVFIPEHKTNNLVLRFLANNIFHPVSMFFFHISLRANDKLEYDYSGATLLDEFKEWFGAKLYKILDGPYSKWGTVYRVDFSSLNLDLDDGLGWDDYDEHGVPYWDYWWHEDPETGDAWRLVLNEDKN